MKVKLLIEGKELEVEISEEEYKKLQPAEEKETGYERVPEMNDFYYVGWRGNVDVIVDNCDKYDDDCYETANYYSDRTIAENNARADQLMRQLRRFAVENREHEIDWTNFNYPKYYISYDFDEGRLSIDSRFYFKDFMTIYFDSSKTTLAAIDEFHDELIWYFTEYQDDL